MNCEIRDKRGGHLWLNNTIVDTYLCKVGYAAFALYAILCRYANNDTQQCFPSQNTIATIMDCSVNTVRTCASILDREKLIIIERDGAGPKSKCVYTLLPVNDLPVIPKQADISASLSISPLIHQNSDVLSPSRLIANKTNRTRLINKGPAKPPDPRHEVFRAKLEKFWKWLNPDLPSPQWGPEDASQLSRLLRKFPEMTLEVFHSTLCNYGDSDDVVPTRGYRSFLPKLENYMAGPHNEFGRLREEKRL